ncbi:MAG: efflux RND transporter permease subunit [Planctomycetes bacterium]|nr:efflux RND transporter permease subunit [Planctomycetota bacterium]
MSLSRAAIHRPVFTSMVTLIVLILGAVALSRLPIDLMPDITNPTITVQTTYENASPQEVEELITKPIEEAMAAVPGVYELTSTSSEGQSSVRVTFTWGTDLDVASNDMRDRLDRVVPFLPDDADRPMLRKFDLAAFPILILGAHSSLHQVQLRRIIDDDIRYRMERVPGVASIFVWGGLEREIHVNLDIDKVKALGLPLDLILSRVTAGNVTLPAGQIDRGNYEVMIRTLGEYTSVDQLRDTVVAMRQGAPVTFGDIGDVEDTWQRVRRIVQVDGQPGVRIAVYKQSGTNTVEVARRAMEELERIGRDFPQIRIVPIIDTSDYIKRSISNVGDSALYGGLLAVAVLLFFLRNIRSTLVISIAIPISIVATFMLMYANGFTLNLMSLGGLALGVGMLVDNAIVVLENIYRLREEGQGRAEAAVNGSEEVIAAIVASTLTTVVVFLPLIFVRGMAGVMFKQLAMVIGFALLCSMAVAMALVPMLAARVLGAGPLHEGPRGLLRGWVFRVLGRFLDGLDRSYRDLLGWCLSHRLVTVGVTLAALGSSLFLARFIGAELMPATDESEVRIDVEMEPGTRVQVMAATLERIEGLARKEVPEMQNIIGSSGGPPWRVTGGYIGDLRIALVPQSQRARSSEQVANDLRPKLRNIPGAAIRVRAGQGLPVLRMGMSSGENVQVEVYGHDFATADELAKRVKPEVAQVAGVADVKLSREAGSPEELMMIDRRKAGDLKVTVQQIADAFKTCVGGTETGYYREGGDEFRIRVKVKDAERMAVNDILDLTLTNAEGQPVVLRNVVSPQPRTGPTIIERKNQERVLVVLANISGRDMGSIVTDIQERLKDVPIPRGFRTSFGGDWEEQQRASGELYLSLGLSLVLVYMVMACQYESLRDPLVVMFSVPLAAIGVILALFLTDTTLNMQSRIGCIMLGGIVVNNAILLVDHTNLLRRRDGMPLREAIMEAGHRRLRPILMTTLTTGLALLPLALALGEGGEAQAPLARVVIGGLTSSTLITLVIIPVVYSLFEGMRSGASLQ